MSKKAVRQGKPVRKKEGSWLSDDVKTNTGLPPQVYGQVRCFCKLTVSQVVWTTPTPPDLALVRVKWWGEQGDGILFRPVDVKKGNKVGCQTTARYPVRSGPCQFATYLSDMGSLTLDLLTGPDSQVLGQATVTQIGLLTNTRPINGFFPVMSASGQKLANLQVSLLLEPLLVSYDNLGAIPTTDISLENGRDYDSMVLPVNSQPLPYSDIPIKPDNTVFISPTAVQEGRKGPAELDKTCLEGGLRQQLVFGLPDAQTNHRHGHYSTTGAMAITTNGDVVSLPGSRTIGSRAENPASDSVSSSRRGLKSPSRTTGPADKDLLSVLVEKGTKLREAMIMSSMNSNHTDYFTKTRSEKTDDYMFAPSISPAKAGGLAHDFMGMSASALDVYSTSPVRNQDFQLYSMLNGFSPGTSVSTDAGQDQLVSDMEEAMYHNSTLQQLLDHNSDFDGVTDVGGYENNYMHHFRSPEHQFMSLPPRLLGGGNGDSPLEAAGNQRPPSRTSSLNSLNMGELVENELGMKKMKKTKRRARSSSRSSSRSQSRSRSNTPRRSDVRSKPSNVKDVAANVLKETSAVKPKKKTRSRSNSRSRSRSRPRRRKMSADGASDSDRLSSAFSENAKVINKQKSDGLSVERLTLLGRVHVAWVNIDSLQLSQTALPDSLDSKLPVSKLRAGKPPRPQTSKKLSTYFVEYQFPVVATSRSKHTPSTVATEVTRVVSKKVKDGAVGFNHHSVFPLMFDGAAVEQWWKSALVFRVYCREAGQQTPVLMGSGGISLKSVLRSDNLYVQREIEILDTSRSNLHNTSHASSLDSSASGRSIASVFGILKMSVELASDHKEFATILARTKLAEMSGTVTVVPIGGEPARIVDQHAKNKDQPVIKSPTKKIDIPGIVSQPITTTAVTGLPPQSPRRKTTDSTTAFTEDSDEMSKLKQQLKATLAALSSPQSQRPSSSHLDAGTNMFGGQRDLEPTTLHTLLLIQEGRDITLHGVPPLHMANRYPGLLQARPDATGRDAVTRNTYLVCRMFWTNDAVHSDVCWGTLNPEYTFLQVAPVQVTPTLLERMRDNFMIVEVWDKKVSSENDKLIGMVKLSLHQFYLSFRERKIANALLKSEYPVMAIDNYIPVVDPFSGLHFGQLKVVLAMGSQSQILNLQRLALGSDAREPTPMKPVYLERQDLLKGGGGSVSGRMVEHQFEIVVEGLRGLKLFENMIWGEADCFVQFFFPAEGKEGEKGEGTASLKSIPSMKCFRTATTLCIPDPTFHDVSRHKLTLAPEVPVQRELLTACANSGGGVTGLPFEVWCRYYHPNVRDQLIAKSTLPLAKLCAMITMHKSNEACVQSFALRLSEVGVEGHEQNAELSAKSKAAGLLDVAVNYRCQPLVSESAVMAVNRNHGGSQVCLSVGIIRAAGLKAAADSIAQLDSSMAYPASVGVNVYVRIKISFLGKESERVTKTVARSFAPEFAHWMDFPCPLLMSQDSSSDATSLAELLESAEVFFEVWHQIPTGLPNKDFYVDKSQIGHGARRLAHQPGDVLLGTAVVPLISLVTRRMGINGWFPVSLPSLGWARPVDDHDAQDNTALDQVVGGLELSVKFAHQDDREHVISVARSVGWSPIDVDVEQADWQDEDSHHNVHGITVTVDQASFPLSSALATGQVDLDPLARCYVRYKFYDKGAVVSKSKKVHASDGSLLCSLDHKHSFMLSHTAPLQWYLREERLEVQVWVTYAHTHSENKPRKRDRLIGSCYIDLESLTNMRRKQQRISGLFPLFKPGACDLKAAFVKAHVVSRVSASAREQTSGNEKAVNQSEVSRSDSETDQSSSDVHHQSSRDFSINKSPRKPTKDGTDPEASFTVVLAVERAMHLPLVTERNRSGEISPTTYVSFQSVERTKPTCSSIFPNSVNPVWDYVVETRLSTEHLYKENKNLVLKVWHKPSDAPKAPDKSCDRVLGFVSVDLTSMAKGFQQICGWYNIMNFNGQCKGQIKVSFTPVDLQSVLPTASSSLLMPSLIPHARLSLNTAAVASSIAQQLASLQQQVMQRMGALTNQSVPSASVDAAHGQQGAPVKDSVPETASSTTTNFWQPKFAPDTRTDDPSKSYLLSSLHRQLQDLDTMTQRLKNRLAAPAQHEDASQKLMDGSHSGDILTGTHSDLSTIHTASMFMNTRDSSEPNPFVFSFEVGTSQESARSGTVNNSSGMDNEADSTRRVNKGTGSGQGHGLIDSGVFSAKNYSEKSAEASRSGQATERDGNTVAANESLTGLPSGGAIEARFVTLALTDPQTLQSTVENSESCGNSHGFVPHVQRNTMTESSARKVGHLTSGSNGKISSSSGGTESGSKLVDSKLVDSNSGSGSARSQEKIIEEKGEVVGYLSSNEEDEEEEMRNGGYGNFHRYRQMLDEKECDTDDDDDDGEVVEIVPRNLNNISIVLALGDVLGSDPAQVDGGRALRAAVEGNRDVPNRGQGLGGLEASPNVNVLEGTSVWCSEDNDESFFQQVFERNTRRMVQKGEHVDEITLNTWLQEQSPDASKTRLESWLEGHSMDKTRRPGADNAKHEQFILPGSSNDDGFGRHGQHSEGKDSTAEDSTPRQETGPQFSEEMKLLLDASSEHEGEISGEIDDRIFIQSRGTAINEKTQRQAWNDEQTWDYHFADHDTDMAAELKDFHPQSAEISGGERSSHSDSPSSSPKKVLSNVGLQDVTEVLPQDGHADALSHSDTEPDQAVHQSEINYLTAQPAFSNNTSSLPSNQVMNGEHTLQFENTSQRHQYAVQGARPKVRNLLSNGDLESSSSSRPHSGTSHNSKTSAASQNSGRSQVSQPSKTPSLNSGRNIDRNTSEETAVSEKCGQTNTRSSSSNDASALRRQLATSCQEEPVLDGLAKNRTNSNVFDQPGIQTSAEAKAGYDDEDFTLDSAYIGRDPSQGPSSQPNTRVIVNGTCASPEDITAEAWDLGQDGISEDCTKEKSKSIIPNFFMSEKDMQSSIKALKMATAAAKHEDKLRSDGKVKAVSELVNKMTSSKTRSSSLSIKNKQPPSAEEAKRIAKIFSSKIS